MTTPSSNVGADASHKSVPEWATKEICRRTKESHAQFQAGKLSSGVAKIIRVAAEILAEHEDKPVDPLLIEAREIVAQTQHDRWIADSPWHANEAEQMRAGKRDGNLTVMAAHEGLKRGIDIGGAK